VSVGKATLRTSAVDADMGGIVWNHALAFEVTDSEAEVVVRISGGRKHIIRTFLNVDLGTCIVPLDSLSPNVEVRCARGVCVLCAQRCRVQRRPLLPCVARPRGVATDTLSLSIIERRFLWSFRVCLVCMCPSLW
jgi:hypothetical protein